MRLQLYKNRTKIDLYAEVDEQDFQELSKYRWHQNKLGYIFRYTKTSSILYLHREILKINDSKILVDHKDHNLLNNRRSNLRVCNRQQNARNMLKKNPHHKYKGYYRRGQNFCAKIVINNRIKYLGTFKTEEEAAKSYDTAAKIYFGEFALLNFPNQ